MIGDDIGSAPAWEHDRVFVRWFFLLGGVAFLLVALFVRERPGEGADAVALTFGLMGFFWAVPQLIIMAARKWRE
jgi:hypothetical protein